MLYRRGAVWWVKFRHGGQVYRRSTNQTDHRAAAARARQIRVEVDEHVGPGGRRPGVALDVLEALDLRRAMSSGLGERRPRTLAGLWAPVLRVLGALSDATELTAERIVRYEGTRRGEGVRGQTIRREVQALRRGLRLALLAGMLERDPVDWHATGRIRSDPPDARRASKPWSAGEIALALRYLSRKAVTAGWRDRLRLIQLTGLRLEELRRLQRSWVRGDVLHVPADATKTRDSRKIPLGGEALEIVRRWARTDEPPFARGKPNLALRAACERAKLGAVITPRDLRAWYLTEVGRVDPVAAQRLAGHRSLATTSRYLSADWGRIVSAAAQVGGTTPRKRRKDQRDQRARSSFG